jgi:hypothetical protein
VIRIKKVPLTAAQWSSRVADACLALPGTSANVALAAAPYHGHRDGSTGFKILADGPWSDVVGVGGIQDQPRFAAIAADARTLDRVAITALKTDELAPVTTALNRVRADCLHLGRAVTG